MVKMKTILLIEDNWMMADNVSTILELANYKVLTALEGRSGVSLARKYHPDLILCDIVLPAWDGYQVLKALHSDKETARIPFIFLTGKSDASDRKQGLIMGATDYITKPFDDVDLLNAIHKRLRNAA